MSLVDQLSLSYDKPKRVAFNIEYIAQRGNTSPADSLTGTPLRFDLINPPYEAQMGFGLESISSVLLFDAAAI